MEGGNDTVVREFLLSGLTDIPELKIPLFLVFLIVYLITIVGNIGIILLIHIDPRLHTPMYYFISHLAFIDVCYSSTITPKMLSDLLAEKKSISVTGCLTQLSSFSLFATTESILLALMAFDRYLAICRPLHYMLIMAKEVCMWSVVGVYAASLVTSVINLGFTFMLSFCGPNKIRHFFCDFMALYKLSCTDTWVNEMLVFTSSALITMGAILIILSSYTSILGAVLKIRSVTGRSKVISTCASHFLCVVIFYGTLIFMYVRPNSSHSQDQDFVASVFYAVIIPMLNPLIYSLRNESVKNALKMIRHNKIFC
ncbi:olfactory receptor 8U3-like [Ambystoma mexicanum]|uniref:olfactory receptor 8U3-like n=1 Tax=Ambystoma mexicanum TaxID=8296 RepID=UPI0037E7DE23